MKIDSSAVRARLTALNALLGDGWETPHFRRLQFTQDGPYILSKLNSDAVCDFANCLMALGNSSWIPNPDLFEPSRDEVTIATVERYGLPLRTVYSLRTGLMRSDPYYNPTLLERLYRHHYREIYDAPDTPYSAPSRQKLFSDQISRAVHFHDILRQVGVKFDSVLDYGCGMGGTLVPFKQDGKRCVGCDLGSDYLRDGRNLGLDLIDGGMAEVRAVGPFDLIIVSHVLEHLPDPGTFLTAIQQLVSEHGAILVEVPGIRSIPSWYQGNILRYLQSAHAWHFNQYTLRRLLLESGFQPIYGDDVVLCIGRKTQAPVAGSSTWHPRIDFEFLEHIEKNFLSLPSLFHRFRGRVSRIFKRPSR